MLFYASLIDQLVVKKDWSFQGLPQNHASLLTTYTRHTRASDTNIIINPMECNHKNGYMGHKNEMACTDVRTACVWCVCYEGGVNKGFSLHLGLGCNFKHS